jgi:2-polyprenyl-6-methoxyphenol hydroxylase-like FAD-dependent oxidoreductase
MFLVAPLPGGIWRISAELRPDDPMAKAGYGAMSATTESLSVSNEEVLDRLQIFLRDRVGDTETRISHPSWISIFRFHRRLASAYRNGRMFLAGDAAHIHSALGGQGMNTGLGDAFNLGWKLSLVAQNRASIRLLDSYQAERRPVAADVVKNTSRAWDIFLGRTPLRLKLTGRWRCKKNDRFDWIRADSSVLNEPKCPIHRGICPPVAP